MRHRSFWLGLIALGFIATDTLSASDGADRPNVILIMADDLGWGDVGFNGNATIKTPALDKMATDGLVMRRFYSASAVCSPTRGSCLTGRHPNRYGIFHANVGHLPTQEITLAELLRERGYTTGHFGKWHLGTLTKTIDDANRGGPKGAAHFSPPQMHGFEVCFSTESKVPTWDPMRKPTDGASKIGWAPLGEDDKFEDYGTRYWNERGELVEHDLTGDDSRVIMDRAVPFVQKAASDGKPFFAVIWFHTPHLPVVAGPKYHAMYEGHSLYERSYYGCITAMDEQIGRLRAALAKAKVDDNTMIWFCSDNGPEGSAKSAPGTAGTIRDTNFRGRKRDLLEGGVRVPGVLVWPGKVKPGATDFPAVTSDYLPTVLEAIGSKMPDDRPIDGISLMPMLEGRTKTRSRPIAFEFGGKIAACDNRHKLIGPRKLDRLALYDIVRDPGEANDLAADRPLVVNRMRAFLESWRKSCEQSRAGADYPEGKD